MSVYRLVESGMVVAGPWVKETFAGHETKRVDLENYEEQIVRPETVEEVGSVAIDGFNS